MVDTTLIEPSLVVERADASSAAALLAVAADPTRLAILGVLADGERCVCDLQEQVPVAANLLSYHLKTLREAGLITAARRGRWIDYRLADGALTRLHAALPPLGTRPGGAGCCPPVATA